MYDFLRPVEGSGSQYHVHRRIDGDQKRDVDASGVEGVNYGPREDGMGKSRESVAFIKWDDLRYEKVFGMFPR